MIELTDTEDQILRNVAKQGRLHIKFGSPAADSGAVVRLEYHGFVNRLVTAKSMTVEITPDGRKFLNDQRYKHEAMF